MSMGSGGGGGDGGGGHEHECDEYQDVVGEKQEKMEGA